MFFDFDAFSSFCHVSEVQFRAEMRNFQICIFIWKLLKREQICIIVANKIYLVKLGVVLLNSETCVILLLMRTIYLQVGISVVMKIRNAILQYASC